MSLSLALDVQKWGSSRCMVVDSTNLSRHHLSGVHMSGMHTTTVRQWILSRICNVRYRIGLGRVNRFGWVRRLMLTLLRRQRAELRRRPIRTALLRHSGCKAGRSACKAVYYHCDRDTCFRPRQRHPTPSRCGWPGNVYVSAPLCRVHRNIRVCSRAAKLKDVRVCSRAAMLKDVCVCSRAAMLST